jgi:hypothetical protein
MPILRETVINEPIANLATLQAISDATDDDGVIVNVVNLGLYKLDKTSTLTIDNNLVVGTNSGTGRWINISNYSGTPTTTVGGILSGVPIPNEAVPYLINQMLKPYLNPTFSSFTLTGIVEQEVGQKITGVQSFAWALTNPLNVQANSINISDISNSLTLVTGHSIISPASYDFSLYPGSGLELDIPGTNIWRIQGTNTNSQNFTLDLNIQWMWRIYWGTSSNTSLNSAQILALANNQLNDEAIGNYTFTTLNYKFFCIPTSFTQPTHFIDGDTNIPIDMQAPVTVSVMNAYGITTNYSVYRTTNQLNSILNMIVS